MRPERIDLSGVSDARAAFRRIARVRFREAMRLCPQLETRTMQGLHDFRIACKRLRYALERFEELEPSLESPARQLAHIQDALGEAHDRDVLLAILPPGLGATRRRLQQEREAFVDAARELWTNALDLLAGFTA